MSGRGLALKSKDLIEVSYGILDQIRPASVRSVCYQLFTRGLISNMGTGETQMVRGALLEDETRIILQAPTGAGKTIMAAQMVNDLVENGQKVIFCVSSLSLIDQTIDRFRSEGIHDIGVIQGAHELSNHLAMVKICSIQTLRRRSIPRADFVIIDEIHVWHDAYEGWINDPDWIDVPFLGLSATPWRKGLGKFFRRLIKVSDLQSLIDSGHLAVIMQRFDGYAVLDGGFA